MVASPFIETFKSLKVMVEKLPKKLVKTVKFNNKYKII